MSTSDVHSRTTGPKSASLSKRATMLRIERRLAISWGDTREIHGRYPAEVADVLVRLRDGVRVRVRLRWGQG